MSAYLPPNEAAMALYVSLKGTKEDARSVAHRSCRGVDIGIPLVV